MYASLPILAVLVAAAWVLGLRAGRRSSMRDGRQAMHDPLTGLPGRALFVDRVGHALRAARRDGTCPAVLLVDLDHFKQVNETLGHEHGDLVLQEVAVRLQATLRTSDTVARLGGDEFGVLVPRMLGEEECAEVATKLAAAFAEPVQINDLSLDLSLRVGASCFPRHGSDAEALLRAAELALQHARSRGSSFELHGEDGGAPRRAALASELRRALNEGRIVAHFQPKVSLRSDEVTGVEALMRWPDAAGAPVSPEEFIPVAEQTGLIGPATLMVMDAALAARQRWLAAGHDLTVAVNLSPRSLLDTRLPDQVAELLARHGVPPSALELEITESVLMADPERAGAVIERLGEMGLHLAVDDFGTGYSSLALLRRLPVDAIKIDRSFVMGMATSHSDAVIVRSTVDLARNLGMVAVAEGVDTVAVWRELRALGCDIAQGHLFGAAMAADAVVPWIEQRRASASGPDEPPTPLHGSTAPAAVRGMTR